MSQAGQASEASPGTGPAGGRPTPVRDRRPLTRDEAGAAWEILAELAGAVDSGGRREEFLRAATRDRQVEFRFQGSLGFGGKFYYDGDVARVGCYGEDRSELRDAVCVCATARLAALLGAAPSVPTPEQVARALRDCVEAMEAVSRTRDRSRRLALARRDPDRTARPRPAELRYAESAAARAVDAMEARALMAREILRSRHAAAVEEA